MRRRVFCLAAAALSTPALAGAIGPIVDDSTPWIGQEIIFEIAGYCGDVEAHWGFGGEGCTPHTQTYVCEPIFTSRLGTSYEQSSAELFEDLIVYSLLSGFDGSANRINCTVGDHDRDRRGTRWESSREVYK